MIGVLLLLLPLKTLSGKDDVVIVEPAAMIVKPSADGKWQLAKTSSTSTTTSTSTQSREARRGEVELDLFQLGTEKGRNEEPAKRSSVQLDLFQVVEKKENRKEEERGAVELNLFGNGSPRLENSERDSKAYALVSKSPSGDWVQKGSSENKVQTNNKVQCRFSSFSPTLPPPSRCCPSN